MQNRILQVTVFMRCTFCVMFIFSFLFLTFRQLDSGCGPGIYIFGRQPFDDGLSANKSRKKEITKRKQKIQRTKSVISKVRF